MLIGFHCGTSVTEYTIMSVTSRRDGSGGKTYVPRLRYLLMMSFVVPKFSRLDALLFGHRDVEGEQPHGHVALMVMDVFIWSSGMSSEQRAHIPEVRNRHAYLAHSPAAIGESGSYPGRVWGRSNATDNPVCPLVQIHPEEGVARRCRRVTGVGAHHPGTVSRASLVYLGHTVSVRDGHRRLDEWRMCVTGGTMTVCKIRSRTSLVRLWRSLRSECSWWCCAGRLTPRKTSLVAAAPKAGGQDEYGMLVPVASPPTYIDGEILRRRLEDAGIKANLANTLDGPRVMVWPKGRTASATDPHFVVRRHSPRWSLPPPALPTGSVYDKGSFVRVGRSP